MLNSSSSCPTAWAEPATRGTSARSPKIDTVSLTVGPGETVALVGESGAGKTVLALEVMGLLPDGMQVTGGQFTNADRLPKLDEAIAEAKAALAEVSEKWEKEKAALEGVVAARTALKDAREAAGEGEAAANEDELKAALEAALATMREAAGDNPMVFGVCDADAVAAVVGDWTGIPMGRTGAVHALMGEGVRDVHVHAVDDI